MLMASLHWSPGLRLSVVGGTAVLHAVLLLLLIRTVGPGVTALAVIPLVESAWLFGLWGGLAMAILIMVPTAYLVSALLSPPQPHWLPWPNYAAGLLLAGGTAGVRTLVLRLDLEMRTRADAEERQRLAQQLLAQTHRQLRAVLERAPVVLFALDSDGIITLAEGRLDAVLGVKQVEPVGKTAAEILANLPDLLGHLSRGLAGSSHAGVIELQEEATYLEITYAPIRDQKGAVTGVGALIASVTERVRGEAAQRDNEVKSRLMATMNHEVRTPLNAILGFAEMLRRGRKGQLNPDQLHYVENIENGGRHLLELVNDSLDLSRLEAGKMTLEPVDLSLRHLIEEAVAQVQPLAETREIELAVDCRPTLTVRADRRRLLQVIWNLVANAIKFTPTGGKIWLSGRRHATRVQIDVKDSGPGIATDQLERIFNEFTQVGSPLEGSGLGLAITRQLVTLMDGKIEVKSEQGLGTTFTVDLPAGSHNTHTA